MKMKPYIPLPVLRSLKKLGLDINEARRRRRISIDLMALRVDVCKNTIIKIEKGNPNVSMRAYAIALYCVGMNQRLYELADVTFDTTGLDLESERLPKRIHRERN